MKKVKEGNDLLRRWLEGSANRFEEHRLDKAAEQDPFLAEALEGYRSLAPKDHEATLRIVEKRLSRRSKPYIVLGAGLRIAAAMAVLLGAAWAVWQVSRPARPSDSLAQDTTPLVETQPEQKTPEASPAPEVKPPPAPVIALKEKKVSPALPAPPASQPEGPVKILDLPTAFTEEADMKASRQAERTAESKGEVAAAAFSGLLTGKVTDEQGNPLPNIEVGWENLRLTTRSDQNGNFLIPQEPGANTLVFLQNGKSTSFSPPQQAYPFTVVLGNQAGPSEAMARSLAKSVSPESPKTVPAVRTPVPEGGFPAFNVYILRNLRYPALALQSRIEGAVVVEFSIPASGIPSDFQLLENPGYGLDLEAIRLLENGPRWTAAFPGQRYVFTVVFKLP